MFSTPTLWTRRSRGSRPPTTSFTRWQRLGRSPVQIAAAENFAAAARRRGVSRIVYLGGLGPEHDLSVHLESRHEVGRILRGSGVPTIEFRASVIIGSGS